jgi:hypothetical protein
MIADGQGLVEDGPFSADEFKERELSLGSVIVDAAIESGAVLWIGEETGFDAIKRQRRLPAIGGPGIHSTVLAKRGFVACS